MCVLGQYYLLKTFRLLGEVRILFGIIEKAFANMVKVFPVGSRKSEKEEKA